MLSAKPGGKAGWTPALVLVVLTTWGVFLVLNAASFRKNDSHRSESRSANEQAEGTPPAKKDPRRAGPRSNLERIGVAFLKHHESQGTLPAPIRSKDGQPLLSWRVAILPFLGEQVFYDEFHLDEPWNSSHNKPLLDRMPAVFSLPGIHSNPGMTYYRSFSGPGTLFDPKASAAPTFASITDGLSMTVAVVEAREAVPWTRPDSEVPIDGEGERASDSLRHQIGGHFPDGAHVLLIDGEVQFLKTTISGLTLKSITTINAGDVVAWSDSSDGTKAETDFDLNRSLFAAVKSADQFRMFEGLPHQGYEDELLEQEKRDKPTVTIQGFPFYKPPLEVAAVDREALKVLLGDENSFRQWRGEKMCGGFHPDYLVEWKSGVSSIQFLVCLGCWEVKAFGPDRSLRCDIERDAAMRISALLSKYRKNRPVKSP